MSAVSEPPPATNVAVSPADQAVITQALLAAANEMGAKLIRSAPSPIVPKKLQEELIRR